MPNPDSFNLEKAVDHSEHGEHGEKTMTYTVFMLHPLGERLNPEKLWLFAVLAVSPWYELRFLGSTTPAESLPGLSDRTCRQRHLQSPPAATRQRHRPEERQADWARCWAPPALRQLVEADVVAGRLILKTAVDSD
ncbi:hypothetical protein [Propionivibrio sp.]|uniref:hypothetical protein n=1 Tax=Propionivibrio sp. TaxID=2212460 RepID=UPI003BF1414F